MGVLQSVMHSTETVPLRVENFVLSRLRGLRHCPMLDLSAAFDTIVHVYVKCMKNMIKYFAWIGSYLSETRNSQYYKNSI